MTTSSITTTPPDHLVLQRPEAVSDGRWEHMQILAHKLVTGHYPWCEDHEDDSGDEGWCRREITSSVSDVVLNNGTSDGSLLVSVLSVHGVDFGELTLAQASSLAWDITQAVDWGTHSNGSGAPA